MSQTSTPLPEHVDPALDPTLDQLSRRKLLTRATAATAAVVAASPLLAQTGAGGQTEKKPSALDDATLDRQTVEIEGYADPADPARSKMFKAFVVHPKTETKRGTVLVVHEIFGLSDHIKDVACRYAQAGYTAIAPDFFTREGTPPPMSGGFGPLMEFVGKVTDAQVNGDLDGAAKYARALPASNGKVGIVGYCWGGRVAMLYDAHAPALNAAIAYYGRISGKPTPGQPTHPIDVADKMNAPLLGIFGAEDTGIPPAEVNKLRDALKAAHKTAELYEYEGAGHAFNNDTRESYRADAAKLAYTRSLEWFGKYLK